MSIPKGIAVVTGAHMKPAQMKFWRDNPATLVDGKYKMNAAAGTAAVLSQAGWLIYATGYNEEILGILAAKMMKEPFRFKKVDLLDKQAVADLASEVAALKKETGLDVHVVHYGGASDTPTPLPHDSVFGNPWIIPGEAAPYLVANNVTTGYNLLQAFREIFKTQKKSKFVLTSAITAYRTKTEHSLDALQKGAGHAWARSLALDLTPEGIYVTEVMPGMTDTGFYDNPFTNDAVRRSSANLGYHWKRRDDLVVYSAERVGEMVRFVLEFPGHVREVSSMPYGQYPHMGA